MKQQVIDAVWIGRRMLDMAEAGEVDHGSWEDCVAALTSALEELADDLDIDIPDSDPEVDDG